MGESIVLKMVICSKVASLLQLIYLHAHDMAEISFISLKTCYFYIQGYSVFGKSDENQYP